VVLQGPLRINTGLSNIATRIAGLDPEFEPGTKKLQVRPKIDPPGKLAKDYNHDLWLDRAREFQTAASKVTTEWGTVDSSINDLPPGQVYDARGSAKNFCQREGRCNVGCLPGARHTLNKQLMNAAIGRPKEPDLPAVLGDQLKIEALAEVDSIRALSGDGYEVLYIVRDEKNNSKTTRRSVKARQVIVAAGSLGTTEILLRSKAKGGLPNLSDRLGYGFSTNGDWVGFIEKTRQWISLSRGPVTTSYAHFHTKDPGTGGNPEHFHTVEDQGIPRPFGAIAGAGVSLIRSLGRGRKSFFFIAMKILRVAVQRLLSIFKNAREQQDFFRDEEELIGRMMCVVAQGRERSVGQFRLGTAPRDTPLRVERDDGKEFWEDPIYDHIKATLKRMAPHFDASPDADFSNPLIEKSIGDVAPTSIGTSHPLGGCRMGKTAADGVVDEYGRVFGYPGLYVSDAAIIPAALGVNPSMTITALALRVADKMIASLP
jgi:cholesterol oxidase